MRFGVILLLCLTACSERCQTGATRCDGNTLLVCGANVQQPDEWAESACAGACVQGPSGTSFCALAASPSPSCEGASDTRCADNHVVTCTEGYAVADADCIQGACVSDGDGAFCSVLPGPDTLCAGGVNSNCEGTTRIQCRSGYRTAAKTCTTAGGCQTATVPVPGGSALVGVCALDATPDPLCTSDTNYGRDAHCDGLNLTQCYGGYVVLRQVCNVYDGSGEPCIVQAGGTAQCQAGAETSDGDPYGEGGY